jgi:hypothetical protein
MIALPASGNALKHRLGRLTPGFAADAEMILARSG